MNGTVKNSGREKLDSNREPFIILYAKSARTNIQSFMERTREPEASQHCHIKYTITGD